MAEAKTQLAARVHIGIGTNLGDRLANIHLAYQALRGIAKDGRVKLSPIYESEPWGNIAQPPFLNAVAELRTDLPPNDLLGNLHRIEIAAGRKRDGELWSPRPLDLDILLIDNLILTDEQLSIPHPQLMNRRFVLKPLADIAPQTVIPGAGVTVAEALINCRDRSWVRMAAAISAMVNEDVLKPGSFIAVEGPIGVGKTTLAKMLAGEFEAHLILEQPNDNPFLPDFYDDPKRYALQTQLTFLLSRHRQLAGLDQRELFHPTVVSDYMFDKDLIFANLTLDEREFNLYRRIADPLRDVTPKPDYIIYLQANPERLLQNIRIRNIPYELDISENYLRGLCELYNQYFFHHYDGSLLIVNAAQINFVGNERHRSALLQRVRELPAGITYFNPEA